MRCAACLFCWLSLFFLWGGFSFFVFFVFFWFFVASEFKGGFRDNHWEDLRELQQKKLFVPWKATPE